MDQASTKSLFGGIKKPAKVQNKSLDWQNLQEVHQVTSSQTLKNFKFIHLSLIVFKLILALGRLTKNSCLASQPACF